MCSTSPSPLINIHNSLHGALSLQALSTWNSLGLLYHDRGSYQESLEFFSECLRMHLQSSFVPGTSELLSLYNNIATTHYVLGEMDQALNFYRDASFGTGRTFYGICFGKR